MAYMKVELSAKGKARMSYTTVHDTYTDYRGVRHNITREVYEDGSYNETDTTSDGHKYFTHGYTDGRRETNQTY